MTISICCSVLGLAGIGMLMTACSSKPESKYEWLNLFFDGVPNPNAPDQIEVVETITAQPYQVEEETLSRPTSTIVLHEPYGERKCQSCHEFSFSKKLGTAREELCFKCHFKGGIRETLTHAPVLSGECGMCHHPHKSKFQHLLIRDDSMMCLQCHSDTGLIPGHEIPDAASASCIDCHHPHGNNAKAFLRGNRPTETP